jgi:hypothetical protein
LPGFCCDYNSKGRRKSINFTTASPVINLRGMKRIIITTLLLLAAGSMSPISAQKSRQYDDDIYGGKSSKTKQEEPQREETDSRQQNDDRTYSSSSGSSADSREDSRYYSDEYYDSDDDYYYSSRINRFNYPFYNRPYWSSFYNPYWYDPYWVDPYWGWSAWSRPGVTISIGYGGPYWSSYWGWSSWYGSPYFGSYWGYPSYGFGYGGYYSGYWNGYYAGLYGGHNEGYYNRGPGVTYGPRYSLRPNSVRNSSGIQTGGYNGFRTLPARNESANASAPIRNEGLRSMDNERPSREVIFDRPVRSNPSAGSAPRTDDRPARTEERPVRNGWSEVPANRNSDATPQREAQRTEPRPWFNRGDAPARTETPRAQEQHNVPQQRYEQPRNEAPSRSYDRGGGFDRGGSSGGGRSFGGGNNGGSGGGSFGGGRRR